jgi:hypothetical protein
VFRPLRTVHITELTPSRRPAATFLRAALASAHSTHAFGVHLVYSRANRTIFGLVNLRPLEDPGSKTTAGRVRSGAFCRTRLQTIVSLKLVAGSFATTCSV